MQTYLKIFSRVLICCLLLTYFMCSSNCNIYAHEIYYDGATPIILKWSDVTNRTANLRINGDMLASPLSSHYSTIRSAWSSASARVAVTQTAFNSSNIDLATADSDYWHDRFGTGVVSLLGICDATSTDNYLLDSMANAKASSKLIKYAGILFTPTSSLFNSNTTLMRYVMVHEIGHALGLGHPNGNYSPTTAASVMRNNSIESYYIPQTHDINDLNNKY